MRSLLKSGIRRIAGAEESSTDPNRLVLPRGQHDATVIAVAAQKGGVGEDHHQRQLGQRAGAKPWIEGTAC